MKKILFINKLEKYEEKKNYIHLDYLKDKINDYDLQDLKKIINFKYDLWLREAKDFHEDISLYFSDINKNWWLTDSSRFIMWKTKNNYSLNIKAFLSLKDFLSDLLPKNLKYLLAKLYLW